MSPLDRRHVLRAATLGAAASMLSACGSGARPAATGAGTDALPSRTASPPRSPAAAPRTPAAVAAALPFEIRSGPTTTDRVALTFHGQGDPAVARALLAEAERAGAQVTVMAVGSWLDSYPDLAGRVLDGGHELGNHTQNHVDIAALPAEAAYAEIARCAQRLRQLTGSIGTWFRPSQARDCTAVVAAQARRAGYAHCLSYDVDSLDYTDPGASTISRTVLGQARAGSVVSLHFGHTGTVAALPAILDGLRQRGLRAVTTSELLS